MQLFHLTISERRRRALARTEQERREMLRALVSAGGARLLIFDLVDDHFHAVVRADKPGYVARDLRLVMGNFRADLELKKPDLQPVDTRAYLSWLVAYALRQPEKHGLPVHPALWTGSCFQDLAGARLLPGFDPTGLFEELPRFRVGRAFEIVGLSRVRLEPASDEVLHRAGAARIADLAAGVYAVGPELRGRSSPVVAARVLAAHACVTVGVPVKEIAHTLDLQRRSIHRLLKRRLDPRAFAALRRRFALEERAHKDRTPAHARHRGN